MIFLVGNDDDEFEQLKMIMITVCSTYTGYLVGLSILSAQHMIHILYVNADEKTQNSLDKQTATFKRKNSTMYFSSLCTIHY